MTDKLPNPYELTADEVDIARVFGIPQLLMRAARTPIDSRDSQDRHYIVKTRDGAVIRFLKLDFGADYVFVWLSGLAETEQVERTALDVIGERRHRSAYFDYDRRIEVRLADIALAYFYGYL